VEEVNQEPVLEPVAPRIESTLAGKVNLADLQNAIYEPRAAFVSASCSKDAIHVRSGRWSEIFRRAEMLSALARSRRL